MTRLSRTQILEQGYDCETVTPWGYRLKLIVFWLGDTIWVTLRLRKGVLLVRYIFRVVTVTLLDGFSHHMETRGRLR